MPGDRDFRVERLADGDVIVAFGGQARRFTPAGARAFGRWLIALADIDPAAEVAHPDVLEAHAAVAGDVAVWGELVLDAANDAGEAGP